MYTELIFGAALKKDTPNDVIESLKYMLGEVDDKPENFPLPDGRCEWLFRGSSAYFPISGVNSLSKDNIDNQWRLSTRSNIKNYEGEIQLFLDWIKPYISQGSGSRDMYAIVTYEEAREPMIYYLNEF
jgi:hypothetical protein